LGGKVGGRGATQVIFSVFFSVSMYILHDDEYVMASSEQKIVNKKRTIYLNRDLDKDIRVAAAKEDKSVSAIVDEALRMYLKAKKSHGDKS